MKPLQSETEAFNTLLFNSFQFKNRAKSLRGEKNVESRGKGASNRRQGDVDDKRKAHRKRRRRRRRRNTSLNAKENNVTWQRESDNVNGKKERRSSGFVWRIMHVERRRRMFLKHVRHALDGSLTELWRYHNLSLSFYLFLFLFLPPSIRHGATPVPLCHDREANVPLDRFV